MGDFRASIGQRSAPAQNLTADDPALGIPEVQPTGGVTESPDADVDPGQLRVTQRRSQIRSWAEQLTDDKAELDQDANRLTKDALGVAQRPLPPALPVNGSEVQKARAGINATMAQAVGKRPKAGGDLGASQQQHRPPVKRRQRVLFGGEPKQQIVHRPMGSVAGAVTIA